MIMADPDQPRKEFNKQELEELAASIRSRGFKEPISVRWNESLHLYMIIDGERRFRAATLIQAEELPCWVQKSNGRDVLIDQIVHNWQRSNLRPYETADALARLRDEFALTSKELAEVTGKPKAEVSKLLALHDKIIPDVQSIARSSDSGGNLTKRHLYSISQLPADRQLDVAEQIRNGNLTAIDTEQLVKKKRLKTVPRSRGVAARQRRFKTATADVVMTFRRATAADEDVEIVLKEIKDQLA